MTDPTAHRDIVVRTLAVLEELIKNEDRPEGLGVREVAKNVGFAPPTAMRILAALEARGLATRRDGKYWLGVAWWRMASESVAKMPYNSETREVLREVATLTSETVIFSLYEPSRRELIYAAALECDHSIRHVPRMNEWMPIYRGASGLAILAYLPEAEQDEIIDNNELPKITAATITDRDELRAELARIRANGFVQSEGQRVAGARSIAAPVWGSSENRPRGSLMISAPESRVDAQIERSWARIVVDAAQSLTMRLGGEPPATYQVGSHASLVTSEPGQWRLPKTKTVPS